MPEYSSVKVIVTTGNTDVVYEIPKVYGLTMEVNNEEGVIQADVKRVTHSPEVKDIVFTIRPNKNKDGTFLTITRIAHGVPVELDE